MKEITTVNGAEVIRAAVAAGKSEREELLQALTDVGLDTEQARPAPGNALSRSVIARHVDSEGHTTYRAGDGANPRQAGTPPRRKQPARKARRGKTPAAARAAKDPASKTQATPAEPAPSKPTAFALYSTGALAIEQNGDVTCVLAPDEAHQLIRYLITQKALVEQIFEGVPS